MTNKGGQHSMQQLIDKIIEQEHGQPSTVDYKRLLIDFADRIGHLDELENYIHDEVTQEDFPTVDFLDLQFEIN